MQTIVVQETSVFSEILENGTAAALPSRTVPMLESDVVRFAREHLARQGYTEIFVPRMVRATGACENVDTLFAVSVQGEAGWFNAPHVYLAQTGQLYLEAWVPSLGRAYCVGPSFRAEEAVDTRHLSEFTMIEIELVTDFQGQNLTATQLVAE